ncbi:MAG: hypothetical protein WA173_20600 [Pseudomonas sp.]|uniref:hypothetical protein n=1 Tax=Pseudomonas sp. TaxID=306 RepID=UPI003BB6224B
MDATEVAVVQHGDKGQWSTTARDGVQVLIRWKVGCDGTSVTGEISDQASRETHEFTLGTVLPQPLSVMQPLASIEVTLTVQVDGRQVSLLCNLPLSPSKFFDAAIGEWPLAHEPADESDAAAAVLIEAPHEALDLAPFIWLHPPTPRELADAGLRYVRLQNPQTLPLYVTLSQCSGAGAAAAKQSAAQSFISSPAFVSALSQLAAPICNFPTLRLQLLATLPGEQSLAAIVQQTENLLGESVDTLLASPDWASAQVGIWQSLFALALSGTASDATLALQLIDVLRVGHFLTLLQQAVPLLEAQRVRVLALAAITALPDLVATNSLAASTVSAAGSWQVLGLGSLKRARQHLLGYQPGELAEVVNVMPHERQERQEHLLSRIEERSNSDTEQRDERDDNRQSTASNELTDALQEVMAAEGAVRNMSNVTPSYENLNQMLTGSWAGGEGGASWAGLDTSRQVQQLTEKAARHMGERVTQQRGRVWQELCERRQSNLIDNAGEQRLVGIYRWVDKLMQLHLVDAGRRLVLAFLVNQPAQPWLNSLMTLSEPPLQKPLPLPAFAVADGQGYADILPSNYQAFAAQYGISDPEPPPADSLCVMATVNRVVIGDLSVLCIPAGYTAVSGQLTTALGDSHYNLVCSIAGQDLSYPAAVTAPSSLTVIPPVASDAKTVGNAVVTPPPPPTSLISTTALTSIKGLTGPVPLTVMSAAALLGVTVAVSCSRGLSNGSDPLLVAWQMRSYARLLQAWQEALRRYQAELALRIEHASAGHSGEIQRDILGQDCLSLLAPAPASSRALEALFSWPDMSWHYQPLPLGETSHWPRTMATTATRPAAERLFQRFLQAPTAKVLLPVNPGCETRLLFDLQFPQPWIGEPASTPVTESTLLLLEEILGPDPLLSELQPKHWTVRLPTAMLYLQQGAQLPHREPCPETPPAGAAHATA